LVKIFEALEAGAASLRAVSGDARLLEPIDEAEGKRDLGADDDKLDALALGEPDKAGNVLHGDGETWRGFGDARIAGSADDARPGGGGQQGADEAMFASAGADDENGARKSGGHGRGSGD